MHRVTAAVVLAYLIILINANIMVTTTTRLANPVYPCVSDSISTLQNDTNTTTSLSIRYQGIIANTSYVSRLNNITTPVATLASTPITPKVTSDTTTTSEVFRPMIIWLTFMGFFWCTRDSNN